MADDGTWGLGQWHPTQDEWAYYLCVPICAAALYERAFADLMSHTAARVTAV